MQTLTLKQNQKPLFYSQPERSHPSLSLRRVLYTRFLKWVVKSKFSTMFKRAGQLMTCLLIGIAYFAPHFLLGLISGMANSHGFKVAAYGLTVAAVFHWRTLHRKIHRVRPTSNQNTYRGIPVDEFATFLFKNQAFKREDAMQRLHVTRDKYDAIATELEARDILVRGDCNARVLNPHLSREELVRQVRDGFPLTFDSHRNIWIERDGMFNSFVLSREREEEKSKDQVRRLEERARKARETIKNAEEFGFTALKM